MGKTAQSRTLLEALLEEDPRLPQAHFTLGKLMETQEDLEGAATHLRKACQLAPGYKAAHLAYAQVLRRLGDTAGAEQQLSLYRSSESDGPALADPALAELLVLDRSPRGYLNRSVAYDHLGRLDLATQELQAALRDYPDNINALTNLISLHTRQGQFVEAQQAYAEVAARKPNEPVALFYWGNTLAAQKKWPEAATAVEQTIALNPEFPGAHTLLGDLYRVSGRSRDAEAQYRAALALRPGDPVALEGLRRIIGN